MTQRRPSSGPKGPPSGANRAARRAGLRRDVAKPEGSAPAPVKAERPAPRASRAERVGDRKVVRKEAPRATPKPPPVVIASAREDGLHRIAKLLARAGTASRREIERMIADGRIKLNGEVITTPATLLANLDGVSVDDKEVAATDAARIFLFHKPTGVLTAERDFTGRKTIYDVLPVGLPRLMPVGRLDLNTEGLLLLTNDGALKRALELPTNGVERSYRARTFGDITQAQLEELIEGVTIEGVRYGRIDANLERSTGHNKWIEMTLREGKNREVRRVLEHFGLQVSRLIRTRYGPFTLGDAPACAIEEARAHEMEQLLASIGHKG
ncbi:MAG: pseudouridine synthase [Sphingopyxis sp.]